MTESPSINGDPLEELDLLLLPKADQLWTAIGGHFEFFGQVLCEFVDNSISNFEKYAVRNREIIITVSELEGGVEVSIEDNGTGIANLAPVMTLGDLSKREGPLNEHGFGLKHALAHANPGNDAWELRTRTAAEYAKGLYRLLHSPYSFEMRVGARAAKAYPWRGAFSGSGTWIYFKCSEALFYTLRKGISGRAGFETCLEYLVQDLGFTYAGLIESRKVAIRVTSESHDYSKTVERLVPNWQDGFPHRREYQHDLGGGKVEIALHWGKVQKRPEYKRYYKANQATSGLEIRFNGRAMGSGLFREVWDTAVHNQYNSFLAILNVISQDRSALPRTVTSKIRPRSDDGKMTALLDLVRKTIIKPLSDALAHDATVDELVHELANKKRDQIRGGAGRVEEDIKVFSALKANIPADLYVYDGKEATLYKARRDMADLRDAYQLLLFWDGAVADGHPPDRGILVAATHLHGVDQIFQIFNELTDQGGNNYRFEYRTWKAEGVAYPPDSGPTNPRDETA